MKEKLTKYNCDYCDQEIMVGSWLMKNVKKHFCDKTCADKWKKEFCKKGAEHHRYRRQKVKCSFCGSELSRTPYQIKHNKNHYCNRQCASSHKKGLITGENHPSWKGGLVKTVCAECGVAIEMKPHAKKDRNFCSQKCVGVWLSKNHSGENAWLWQGGINDLQNTIRKSTRMKEWVRSVFERDDFTCKKCDEGNNRLNAHHLKSVAHILRENNITTIEEALACEELWDLKNGETLCYECHKEFHREYGVRRFTPGNYVEWINMEVA